MVKRTFRPAYLSLSAAAERFRSEDDLVAALREGTLSARARLTKDFTVGTGGQFGLPAEPTYGAPEPVPVSAWRDMEVVLDRDLLQDDQM